MPCFSEPGVRRLDAALVSRGARRCLVPNQLIDPQKKNREIHFFSAKKKNWLSWFSWPAAVGGYDSLFRRVLGQVERALAAAGAAARRWFQGIAACRLVFGSVKK